MYMYMYVTLGINLNVYSLYYNSLNLEHNSLTTFSGIIQLKRLKVQHMIIIIDYM